MNVGISRIAQFAGIVCMSIVGITQLDSPLAGQRNRGNELPRSNRARDAEYEVYRAFYLQHQQRDLPAALQAYERALSLRPGRELRAQIEKNQQSLQEDLAAENLASLMPAESIAYLELGSPGLQLEKLATLIGIDPASPTESEPAVLEIEDGFAISSNFRLSPALVEEMSKIRGGAVAIQSISQRGDPEFVAVLHPGDSGLLAGLLDTGMQLIQGQEQINGYPTYQIEGELWLVKTSRLVIVSNTRTQITGVISRLEGSDRGLADNAAYQAARKNHADALAFAFVQPAAAFATFGPMLGDEAQIASVLLDIPHMEFVAWSMSCQENGIQTRLDVEFDENHRSIAYNLTRTAKLGGESIQRVPGNAAVVAAIGLNPKLQLAAGAEMASQFSAMDIGREFFANIQEASLFVLPSAATREVPDCGLVIAANDIEKSATLWNELLSLPEKLGLDEAPQGQDVSVGNLKGRRYSFADNDIPDLTIVRLDNRTLVVGTHKAVESVVNSPANSSNLVSRMIGDHAYASKAVYVHAGRALQLASTLDSEVREMHNAFGPALGDLSLTWVADEGPNRLVVQTELANLPKFGDMLRTLAKWQEPALAQDARDYDTVDQPSASDRPDRGGRGDRGDRSVDSAEVPKQR